eukprot:138146_1
MLLLLLFQWLLLQTNALDQLCTKRNECDGYETNPKIDCCYGKCFIKPKKYWGCGAKKIQQFICPKGQIFESNRARKSKQTAMEICSKDESVCPNWMHAWKYNENGCSIPSSIPSVIRNDMMTKYKTACWIHDTCYNSIGVSKEQCDEHFHYNLLSTCLLLKSHKIITRIMNIFCQDIIAKIMKFSVSKFGKGNSLWKNSFCVINEQFRRYVMIKNGKYYMKAGLNKRDEASIPKVSYESVKPDINYHINDRKSWVQFIIEESKEIGFYYIMCYSGRYLVCGSDGKLHQSNKKRMKFKMEKVGDRVRFMNSEKGYIYIKKSLYLGCTKAIKIKKASKSIWSLIDLPNSPKSIVK